MVELCVFKIRIKIDFLFTALVSLLSLLDKSETLFLSLCFSLLHELGHVLAIGVCKAGIEELRFSPFGIAMTLSKNTCLAPPKEFFVLSSGCAVNLFCVLFLRDPRLAYINAAILLFNILPIGNLDGGRILRLFFNNLFGESRAETLSMIISLAVLVPISATAFYMAISEMQFSLLVCCIYLSLNLLIKKDKLFD